MKIFKILLILALGLQIGFAENNEQSEQLNDNSKIFKNQNDGYDANGACSWHCREVNDGYRTLITGFDWKSGTTKCNVYKQTDSGETPLTSVNANRTVKSCSLAENMDDEAMELYGQLFDGSDKYSSKGSSIKYDSNQQGIRLSQFMAALVTLDPNIIDRVESTKRGQIALTSGGQLFKFTNITLPTDTFYANNEISFKAIKENFFNNFTKIANSALGNKGLDVIPLSAQTTSALDGFNKNNMAYFNDLFASNSKIYQHLQVFIFILVGGFFVMQIGASKLQAYLENRGESEGKQPYLHKFYIPLLMVGVFFMPIPEGNGYHSTVMQNMIRYFAQYSTNIADMAHSVGAKTYVDKVYKKAGGLSSEGVGLMLLKEQWQKHNIQQMKNAYSATCDKKWGKRTNVSTTNRPSCGLGSPDIIGTKYDISCDICQNMEMEFVETQQYYANSQIMKETITNFKTKYEKDLETIDKYFAVRNNQLGWIDVILTPTSSILVEMFTLSEALDASRAAKEKQEEAIKNNRNAILMGNQGGSVEATNDEIGDSWVGFLGGRLVWLMFPGATGLKDFIMQSWDTVGSAFKTAMTLAGLKAGGIFGGIAGFFSSSVITIILGLGKVPLSYFFTTVLMEWTFAMIPLLAISTACLIAYISYLVSLCKYFYISPFVTAWAMATKRTDKIIDFLLAGIAIFFKPVLIVLFVCLALFLHSLIEEFFVFVSFEQFSSIKTSFWNFHTNFIIGAIGGLLRIFGMLASSYIAWKLIVTGPTWALGLIGLDGKQDDAIAQGIENNLARRAFVA